MTNANLYALLEAHFPADRSSTCLETPHGAVWTWAEVEAESARYASLLHERGVEPGDRVAVQVEKSPRALILYLACLRAGAVYLPLNPAYPERELGLLPRRCRAPAGGCAAGIRGRRRGAVQAPRHRRSSHARRRGGRHPGRGEPVDAGALRHRRARARRPRRTTLHLRHHRQAQGRDAHPRQPVLERAGAARGLGLSPRRRAPPHAPPLPHPRAVRGVPHVAASTARR